MEQVTVTPAAVLALAFNPQLFSGVLLEQVQRNLTGSRQILGCIALPGSGAAYGYAINRHDALQRCIDQDILDPSVEKLPKLHRAEQGEHPVISVV